MRDNSGFNAFSTNKGSSSSGVKEFLESNSLVAKFAFLILVTELQYFLQMHLQF
jgi:hypothetical protein